MVALAGNRIHRLQLRSCTLNSRQELLQDQGWPGESAAQLIYQAQDCAVTDDLVFEGTFSRKVDEHQSDQQHEKPLSRRAWQGHDDTSAIVRFIRAFYIHKSTLHEAYPDHRLDPIAH